MSVLKEALFDVIKHRRLNGGLVWTRERLLSRIRYLEIEHKFPFQDVTALAEIRRVLEAQENARTGRGAFFHGPQFSIRDVLDDVAGLEAVGECEVKPWWTEAGAKIAEYNLSDEALTVILDEHYRRAQQAYDEVVRSSFAKIADGLGFHSVLPVRWHITVIRRVPHDKDLGIATTIHHCYVLGCLLLRGRMPVLMSNSLGDPIGNSERILMMCYTPCKNLADGRDVLTLGSLRQACRDLTGTGGTAPSTVRRWRLAVHANI